jgi:hypothetical protein
MQHLVTILAFLGAVLVAFTVQMFVPETPIGRAAAFVAFAVAMYPLVRISLMPDLAGWRYWAGLLLATVVGLSLDVWRGGISDRTNDAIAVTVFGIATICVVASVWRSVVHRRKG